MLTQAAPTKIRSRADLSAQIRGKVQNPIDLLEEASRFGVNSLTIQKILIGQPISRFIEKKLRAVLEGDLELPYRKRSHIERLFEVFSLYQALGTLAATGRKVGLSRERVRQLLNKGTALGLFEYRSSSPPKVSREEILSDYRRHLKWKAVARLHHLSPNRLHRLINHYHITEKERRAAWLQGHKERSLARYDSVVRALGRHPTTTELQRIRPNRALSTKIKNLWGSIALFRKEQNIPRPPRRRTEG